VSADWLDLWMGDWKDGFESNAPGPPGLVELAKKPTNMGGI